MGRDLHGSPARCNATQVVHRIYTLSHSTCTVPLYMHCAALSTNSGALPNQLYQQNNGPSTTQVSKVTYPLRDQFSTRNCHFIFIIVQVSILNSNWRSKILSVLNATGLVSKPKNGAFLHSCHGHCIADDDVGYNVLKINRTSARTAVVAWWDDDEGHDDHLYNYAV